jgi:hypothetical protein
VRGDGGRRLMDLVTVIDGNGYRYAQEKGGQQLHLVQVVGDGVSLRARCGRHVDRWRMTINVPLGHACKNCWRTAR